MNNPMPFFNPFLNQPINEIINKIEKLEKDIKILENRINELEKKSKKKQIFEEEPTDMYMI